MTDRFEKLTIGVARIYKSIQHIKKHKMNEIGLKGTHVMCLYYLYIYRDGLTAAELCSKCREDKAGISRILADLEQQGYITYNQGTTSRKYRTKALLTEAGADYAAQMSSLILDAVADGGQGLSDSDREVFYRVLGQIADNLEDVCSRLS